MNRRDILGGLADMTLPPEAPSWEAEHRYAPQGPEISQGDAYWMSGGQPLPQRSAADAYRMAGLAAMDRYKPNTFRDIDREAIEDQYGGTDIHGIKLPPVSRDEPKAWFDTLVGGTPADAALNFGLGGTGRLAKAATALGGLFKMSDPAEAGPLDKIGKILNPIRAYHGSPHVFDKFDMSKIGTGEGAAAYGHGLYFAENPALAEFYRSQLAGGPEITRFTVGGKTVGPHNQFDYSPKGNSHYENIRASLIEDALINQADLVGDPKQAQSYVVGLLKDRIKTMPDEYPKGLADARRLLSEIERPGGVRLMMGPRPGATYEVGIHAKPEQFLDWDKPLAQMSPEVQTRLKDAWLAHPEGHSRQTGAQIYDAAGMQSGMVGRDQGAYASQALREAGIPGIRYLDQGSRTAGQGTSNYVVNDDRLIDIMRKYGLAGLTAGGMGGVAAQNYYQQ